MRDLLKAGKWKEADQETLAVMLKATGRVQQGWLEIKSIENFPCTDLRTIDQLWVEYSNGRFGFSVQKRIWESVAKDYEKFGDRVGLRKGMLIKQWLAGDECTYTTNAPQGHLPCSHIIQDTKKYRYKSHLMYKAIQSTLEQNDRDHQSALGVSENNLLSRRDL